MIMNALQNNTSFPILSLSPSESPPNHYPLQRLFPMTSAGVILSTMAGILSTISSLVILNIIRVSPQKLTTTYHRIMAFMSIFDIMASVSMALTTLPMPSDDMLRFDGPMIGNKTTCQVQGYFITLGLAGGGALYMCLSWYFLCSITLEMDMEKIRKRIEPICYVYTIIAAFTLSGFNMTNDAINSVPKSSYCIMGPEHSGCTHSIDEFVFVCDESSYSNLLVSLEIAEICVGFNVLLIVLAMVIIVRTVWKKNKGIRNAIQELNASNQSLSTGGEDVDKILELQYSRVLVVQALMYIFTYLFTWSFVLVPQRLPMERSTMNIILAFQTCLLPAQGFWNLIIFLYDKAYLVYQSEQEKGYWSAIKITLLHPDQYPSGIVLPPSLLEDHMDDDNDDQGLAAIEARSREELQQEEKEHDLSLSNLEGQQNAKAILRNSYNNTNSRPSSASPTQGGMSTNQIWKMLHSLDYDEYSNNSSTVFKYDHTLPFEDSTSNVVVDMNGRRRVRIYLNPSAGNSASSTAGSSSVDDWNACLRRLSNNMTTNRMNDIEEDQDEDRED